MKGGTGETAPEGPPPAAQVVARVLPDVSGFQRELDYLVPAPMVAHVRPGTIVRVPLQGRRARGWVLDVPVEPVPGLSLRPLAKVSGWGPEPELLELSGWAAWRWWGRRNSFLATASPLNAVADLVPAAGLGRFGPLAPGPGSGPALAPSRFGPLAPGPGFGPAPGEPESQLVEEAWEPGPQVLRLPPSYRAAEAVLACVRLARAKGGGPVLVVAPTSSRAEAGRAALDRVGLAVALLPGQWAQARAGAVDVVIGARAAAWGPAPGLAAILVLDAHDQGLAQTQSPTWDAVTVAVERARRANVPCLLVSSCPPLELLARAGDKAHVVSTAEERRGWAPVTVVDMRAQDPRDGLYSAVVADLVRGPARVACILNRKGRAQLLACGSCGSTATCEKCSAAVHLQHGGLVCRRCGTARPPVCAQCGSVSLKSLRVGVARAREQLEALAGRPVGEVTGATTELPSTPVLVGTEALLHREGAIRRAGAVGAVVFLDFDQEILAPRYRAAEEALALLARASRLVAGRSLGGRVVVQTRVPAHPVLEAALLADPGLLAEEERPVRRSLRLPPYGALALVSGPGAGQIVGQLAELGPRSGPRAEASEREEGTWLVKAPNYEVLADLFSGLRRPDERARVEIGPQRT